MGVNEKSTNDAQKNNNYDSKKDFHENADLEQMARLRPITRSDHS